MSDSIFKKAELLAKDLSKVTENVYEIKKYIDETDTQTYYLLFKDNVLVAKNANTLSCITDTLKNIVNLDTTKALAQECSVLSGEFYSLIREQEYFSSEYSIFNQQHFLCRNGEKVKVEKLTLPYLRKHNLSNIYHYLIKLKKKCLKDKEAIKNSTKPVVTMVTMFDVNTIPFKSLTNMQLKELKDNLNKEIDLREQQFISTSESSLKELMLPLRYRELSFAGLETHISSIISKPISVCTTSIVSGILLVRYIYKDDYS